MRKSNKAKTPIISVITVVFNGADTLRATIESIVPQLTEEIEYIIIDGGSTDGTIEIIKEYGDIIENWVSEPDTGIYNAMNKGSRIAKGRYIHFLNSGDTYIGKNALKLPISIIKYRGPKFISSTVNYIMPDGSCKPLSMTGDVDTICHPGLIVRADIYQNNQFFESIKYASDIEFFIRVINREDVYINNQLLVAMPSGGVGASPKCLRETIVVYLRYGKYLRAIYSAMKLAKAHLSSLEPKFIK